MDSKTEALVKSARTTLITITNDMKEGLQKRKLKIFKIIETFEKVHSAMENKPFKGEWTPLCSVSCSGHIRETLAKLVEINKKISGSYQYMIAGACRVDHLKELNLDYLELELQKTRELIRADGMEMDLETVIRKIDDLIQIARQISEPDEFGKVIGFLNFATHASELLEEVFKK